MINGKNILAIIPARGGSKGVPRKNIRDIAGKPLIAWTIAEAQKSKYLDRVILSSEDQEIIETAKSWGCEVPFVRPLNLAQDTTPGIDPVLHALVELSLYDYVVLLQPTSPLRRVADIDGCIEQCVTQSARACVTVTEPEKSPYWMYTMDSRGQMTKLLPTDSMITRRQDLPRAYALNGAVYVAECKWLLKSHSFITEETLGFTMPKERSYDIDTELDFRICEFLLLEGNNRR
jgi:CMP-N,N'-diacetyllegionaminic acid synthase